MKTFIRSACLCLLALALAGAGRAGEFYSHVAVTSNYRSGGQDQNFTSDKAIKPELQGSTTYVAENGFYLGVWGSTLSETFDDNWYELDPYVGVLLPITDDLAYRGGMLGYIYPGAGSSNTWDTFHMLTWKGLTLKYLRSVTSRYFSVPGGRGTQKLRFLVDVPITPRIHAVGQVGRIWMTNAAHRAGMKDYTDWEAGLKFVSDEGFELTAVLNGANKRGQDEYGWINKNRLVLTVAKNF